MRVVSHEAEGDQFDLGEGNCWARSLRNFSLATSSKIIFRPKAREMKWALKTEELKGWKMRGTRRNAKLWLA